MFCGPFSQKKKVYDRGQVNRELGEPSGNLDDFGTLTVSPAFQIALLTGGQQYLFEV